MTHGQSIVNPSLSFQGGTLVLYNLDNSLQNQATVHPHFRWIKGRWRCEGYRYPDLLPWLKMRHFRDRVPGWRALGVTLHDARTPHDYQLQALNAWEAASRLGSIVLPTGAGKTFLAIQAIARTDRSERQYRQFGGYIQH